jgi:hypothetical protein
MRPVPRWLQLVLGVAILLSVLYLVGRYHYLQDNVQLPVPDSWKVSFALDPMTLAAAIALAALSAVPTLVARRHAVGSWVFFGASLLSCLPIWLEVHEWGRSVRWSNSAAGYMEGSIVISMVLLAFSAFAAALWAAAAGRGAESRRP